MTNDFKKKINEELLKILNNFKKEMQKYTLNKTNISFLEDIKINYYNSTYKINQIANINIENNNIFIKPFDTELINKIFNEINKSNFDMSSTIQDGAIKITFPQNTIERRQNFIKKIKDLSEKYKISIRNIRREYNANIKILVKENNISKDEEKKLLNDIQREIDETIKNLDNLLTKKINELNTI